jgi:hypothetical protein
LLLSPAGNGSDAVAATILAWSGNLFAEIASRCVVDEDEDVAVTAFSGGPRWWLVSRWSCRRGGEVMGEDEDNFPLQCGSCLSV